MPSRLRADRRGMTLIEVMFAIVILSGVMLAMSRFGQEFTRATRNAANLAIASDLAAARIETIRAHGIYATLPDFEAEETSADEDANPSMTGYDGFTRTTVIDGAPTDSTDFVTVTVTVTATVLKAPVTKTVVIATF